MNCLSARRIISTDVKEKNDALSQHLHECSSCKAFYRRQLEFNAKLKEAVEIDVPEGLGARILVEHKLNQKRARNSKYRWAAMAASVLLVVSISLVSTLHSPPTLAGVILDHVKEEAFLLETHEDISIVNLNQILKPHGLKADENIGRATHAGNCLIQDKLGAHIVFKGKNAPVTLIIVPQKLSGEAVTINDQQFSGVLMSTSKGALAILSEDKESLVEFEDRLHSSLMTFI